MNLTNPALLKSQAYINGAWINNSNTFPVYNPFDGTEIAQVADCNGEDANRAIDAAAEAFKIWSQFTANKRAKILMSWYQLQMDHAKDLAKILTLEQGKPFGEAYGEIKYGASYVEWFAEEAKRVYGDVIPGQAADKRITVIKQPVGVVGAITPWNFPSAMITRKVAPALAAGCTVVIKPSDQTPLSALALMELAEQAGFPPGVINVLPCLDPKPVGEALTSNRKVKKISFTGSTAVGKLLLRQAADQVKKVSMELGGNAPFIVFEDADVADAVEGYMASKFRNAGQTCVCANRLFVHEEIYDQFVSKLTKEINSLTLGNGMDRGVQIGPMINEKAIQKDEELIADAKQKGAKIAVGGSRAEGLIFEPTLVCEVDPSMDIFHQEIFGPVSAIYKFNSEEEVVALANDTNFGLASYFYGRDYAKIWRVAEALEYGMVGINCGVLSNVAAPFGGIKESGFGREGSKYGIGEYLNIKYMCWSGVK